MSICICCIIQTLRTFWATRILILRMFISFEVAGSQISRHTYASIDFQNSRFRNSQNVKRLDSQISMQTPPVPPYKFSHPNLTPFDTLKTEIHKVHAGVEEVCRNPAWTMHAGAIGIYKDQDPSIYQEPSMTTSPMHACRHLRCTCAVCLKHAIHVFVRSNVLLSGQASCLSL